MKTAVLVLTLAMLSPLVAEGRSQNWCEAQRVVEMRNAVLAGSLLCKEVITPKIYDRFIIKNRSRIKAANDIAVAYHMKKFGSRKHFDHLDTMTMNTNAQRSAKNPVWFCERMKIIAEQVQKMNIIELLAKQNELDIPTCD